jgi:hypothetical protein
VTDPDPAPDSSAARQAACLARLDAIEARCTRGEITADEANALQEAELERAHLETLAIHAARLPDRRLSPATRVAYWFLVVLSILGLVQWAYVRGWIGG